MYNESRIIEMPSRRLTQMFEQTDVFNLTIDVNLVIRDLIMQILDEMEYYGPNQIRIYNNPDDIRVGSFAQINTNIRHIDRFFAGRSNIIRNLSSRPKMNGDQFVKVVEYPDTQFKKLFFSFTASDLQKANASLLQKIETPLDFYSSCSSTSKQHQCLEVIVEVRLVKSIKFIGEQDGNALKDDIAFLESSNHYEYKCAHYYKNQNNNNISIGGGMNYFFIGSEQVYNLTEDITSGTHLKTIASYTWVPLTGSTLELYNKENDRKLRPTAKNMMTSESSAITDFEGCYKSNLETFNVRVKNE
eukprot:NODE_233_length_12044_cov_0.738803.p5 type:complete len:302 gc:universal NODE_233_length_12044_cov_0.738803:1567-2472(+)